MSSFNGVARDNRQSGRGGGAGGEVKDSVRFSGVVRGREKNREGERERRCGTTVSLPPHTQDSTFLERVYKIHG